MCVNIFFIYDVIFSYKPNNVAKKDLIWIISFKYLAVFVNNHKVGLRITRVYGKFEGNNEIDLIFIPFQIDGLGTYSNVAVYAALVISCMFLPSYVIKTFTVKWGLVMCMFCYSTYIATQFYPQFYTIIPGAIILGIGAAPMWSAKCTYLTQVSIVMFDIRVNI